MRTAPAVGVRVLVGLALAIAASRATAGEPSTDDCLACHESTTEAGGGRTLPALDPKAFAASPHGDLGCTACHTAATDVPHDVPLPAVGLEPCAACHADAVEAYRGSVHGANGGPRRPDAATCASCHGDLHALRPHDDPASPAHRSRLAATCAHCHATGGVQNLRIPIARPVEAYLESAHARAVADGRPGAVCSDCHGSHGIARSDDPRSSIARTRVPETCGKCHRDVLAAYRESVHGEALARGVADAPVCTDCHGEHRILAPSEPTSPVFAANIPGQTCGRCHGNTRLSEKWGLDADNAAAFADSYHGLALRLGKLTVANCSSCHGVHDIRPSSDPRSHVHPANLPTTCGKCHPGAGTRFELGPVHAAGTTIGGRAVAWIRTIYLWLIGLTIGGMVVHNALDLGRKARTPRPPVPALPPQAARLTRAMRWQHGLVMLSFPTLVYTGFALTYPDRGWAAPFLRWEARWGLRGLLHRGAAVVLLVALAWHLVDVARNPRLRARLRGLRPGRDDLRVLAGTFAWYLGRRSHPPRAGRFHYAEKAEYWAFLWGTVVMALTGFPLWFENLTLRFAPAWVPDVATAIHFYEAVLATLAILVWHLYWVVFDPFVYPMDWTWWTGQPPPHRAAERLPEPPPDA